MAGVNWLIELIRNAVSSKGQDPMVTADSSLTYAPVWYAVNKISGHVGYLPLNLHQEQGRDVDKARDHLAYRLMRRRPNPYQSPFIFKRQLTCHALLWGNGRAFIYGAGRNRRLIPLLPDRCRTVLIDGEKVHLYKMDRNHEMELNDDIAEGIKRSMQIDDLPVEVLPISDREVFHVHGLGFDGVEGKSLISLASRSWGLGMSAELREKSHHQRGYGGGLLLQAPPGAFRDGDDAKEFLDWFRKSHDGPENAGRSGLLREGITANVPSMSNADAQFMEQRMFQRQDVALWFLLEQILGDDSSVSYNSLEQKNLAYLQNCLAAWLTVWEEEANNKLLSEMELNQGYYFKFNDGALLRTDKKTTMDVASQGVASRILSPNEARKLFDLNPYDGGDTHENPAITPGSGQQESDEDPAAMAMLGHMVGVEINRVRQAVSSKDFCSRINDFYDGWADRLAKSIEKIGGDPSAAVAWCELHRGELMDIASTSTPDEFSEQIESIVAAWKLQVSELLDDAMGAAKC